MGIGGPPTRTSSTPGAIPATIARLLRRVPDTLAGRVRLLILALFIADACADWASAIPMSRTGGSPHEALAIIGLILASAVFIATARVTRFFIVGDIVLGFLAFQALLAGDGAGVAMWPFFHVLQGWVAFRCLYGNGRSSAFAVAVAMVVQIGSQSWISTPDSPVVLTASVAGLLLWAMVAFAVGRVLERQESPGDGHVALLPQLVRASEDERKRLAADLHDGPVQKIAAMGLKLARVDLLFGQGKPEKAKLVLKEAQEGITIAVEGLRHTMATLRPPALDERGLCDAIQEHMLTLDNETKLECAIENTMPRRPSPAVETALYRIAQEALTNIVKHASARRVTINLSSPEGRAVLEIGDDGVGFNVDQFADRNDKWRHFGLTSTQERVHDLLGDFEVESCVGAGTRVRVSIPSGRWTP